MKLSNAVLPSLQQKPVKLPAAQHHTLPEKVLQFGTGVLLRGLPDYFIDEANRQGIFNGRIVVVKSTAGGNDLADFATQDMLYTHVIRGLVNQQPVEEMMVNASISRIISAADHWQEVLAVATNPDIEIIISNVTEVGFKTDANDSKDAAVPVSFPAKLTAVLYQRFQHFNGAADKGFVILPAELITNNGALLKEMVLGLAKQFSLPEAFINWVATANHFCNTLVDRIVPGKLPAAEYEVVAAALGYDDSWMIMSEPYALWAIECADATVAAKLSFAQANSGMVLAPSINKYVELKLRLLNGTHTFSCGLAHLAGFTTVKEAMADAAFFAYIKRLMLQSIVPAVQSSEISTEEATVFASAVLDRFANPYINHKWLSITFQYTEKMRTRNVPLMKRQLAAHGAVTTDMQLGFAAYVLFMNARNDRNGQYIGEANGQAYAFEDIHIKAISAAWQTGDAATAVTHVCAQSQIWGEDLREWPGFVAGVTAQLQQLQQVGAREVLNANH